MVLIPLTRQAMEQLPKTAISAGAVLLRVGPVSGSLIVTGRRDRLVPPLLRAGIIALSTSSLGCGAKGFIT
jgi:hypothetical protein